MAKKKKPISMGKLALVALIVFGISAGGTYMYMKLEVGSKQANSTRNPKAGADSDHGPTGTKGNDLRSRGRQIDLLPDVGD